MTIMRLSFVFLVLTLQMVEGSWLYLGVLSSTPSQIHVEMDHNAQMSDQATRCSSFTFLTPSQREMCEKESRFVDVISTGASLGISECQAQFSDRRWNCSTFNTTDVFGKVLKLKTRETAYIYAISSAGIMYSITKACASGELLTCGCDTRVLKQDTKGEFEWGGCSENTNFGAKFSKGFVDVAEKKVTDIGLMNLWNNEAGRRTVKNEMQKICKCHGVSAACTVKVCWRKMRSFRDIGTHLKRKFDGASLVKFNSKKKKLKRFTNEMKKPTKNDLVYLEESPDYCKKNVKLGSLGTKGRRCNKDSYGLDGCRLMCCGRGYHTIVRELTEDCDCKFVWCCRVDCQSCHRVEERHYCN